MWISIIVNENKLGYFFHATQLQLQQEDQNGVQNDDAIDRETCWPQIVPSFIKSQTLKFKFSKLCNMPPIAVHPVTYPNDFGFWNRISTVLL